MAIKANLKPCQTSEMEFSLQAVIGFGGKLGIL